MEVHRAIKIGSDRLLIKMFNYLVVSCFVYSVSFVYFVHSKRKVNGTTRSVVSSVTDPAYKLCKYINTILPHANDCLPEFTIRSSIHKTR